MGRVFTRGEALYLDYQDAKGKRRRKATGFLVGQERAAKKLLKEVEKQVRLQRLGALVLDDQGPMTVRRYSESWIDGRRGRIRTVADEESRLRLHALPRIGDMPIDEIKPRHIRDLIVDLRNEGKLAPRTIHHVYGVLSNMFKNAVFEEAIAQTPCVLPKGVLPPKVDKDPEWRAGAVFKREEILSLMSDPIVPVDRHLVYAIKGLAGLRHGELAGLRWSHYRQREKPLGQLVIAHSYEKRTKTNITRLVPVHSLLASMLAAWKLSGWERHYGRAPKAGDLIVPTRNFTMRDVKDAHEALHLDLKKLGLNERRGHDLRRSFVTIAQIDGARRDILEAISHGPRGDIVSMYTSFPWPALCEEISKMKFAFTPVEAESAVAQIGLPKDPKFGTAKEKGSEPTKIPSLLEVTPTGFEPVSPA